MFLKSSIQGVELRRWLPIILIACFGCSTTQEARPAGTNPEVAKTPAVSANKGSVLVVLSSANSIPLKEGKRYRTGYFLNEVMVPVRALMQAQYQPVFATPTGSRAEMDVHSDSASFFANEADYKDIQRLRHELGDLQQTRSLKSVVAEGLDRYRALLIPGGHAAMGDLTESPELATVLRHFHEQGKPTAAICHGPGALLASLPKAHDFIAALANGDRVQAKQLGAEFPYTGYRLTVFSTAEEQTVESGGPNQFLGGKVLFYLEDALRTAGANVEVEQPFKSHVVRDHELITAQQPASDAEFTQALLAAIHEKETATRQVRASQ
jgi:putative intracellular protease/amidase